MSAEVYDHTESSGSGSGGFIAVLGFIVLGMLAFGLSGVSEPATETWEDYFNGESSSEVVEEDSSDPFGLQMPSQDDEYADGLWSTSYHGESMITGSGETFAVWQRQWDGSLDLPFTEHAKSGHNGDGEQSAEKIRDDMKSKICRPIDRFFCTTQIKLICPLFPENPVRTSLWAGLILGIAGPENLTPVIVTGYVAPFEYWMASMRRDGCVYIP